MIFLEGLPTMRSPTQRSLLFVAAGSALLLCACGSDDAEGSGSGAAAGSGAMAGSGGTAGSGGSGNSAGVGGSAGQAGGGPAGGSGGTGGAPCVAALLLEEGFESGSIPSELSPSGNAPDVVMGDAREGSYAMRSQLTPQSPVTYRTEVAISNNGLDLQADTAYWVGFGVKLDADYEDVTDFNDTAMLFQAHYRSWKFTDPPPDAQPLVLRHRQPANFFIQDEVPGVGQLYEAPRGPVGQWVDWVFNFQLSDSNAGFIKAWRDGTQVVDHTGPNHQGFFDQDGFYLKMGMYSSQYQFTPMPSGASRTVYHDALRIAGSDACYALVAPR